MTTGVGGRRILVTTTLVMAVATVMQYSVSSLGPLLVDDLRLSAATYGSLFTLYYAVGSVGSFVLGDPTQRMGAQAGMTLVVLAAAAGLLTVAAAPSLVLIYIGLVGSGIASAFANPATNLALMHVPNRAAAMGVKQSGVQISALAGGVLVAPLGAALGWRAALGICAAVCLVMLVPVVRVGTVGKTASGPAGQRRRHSLAGLAMFAFLMGCALSGTISYLPLYATTLGLSHRAAGLLMALFGVCSVTGRIAWGLLSQRWARFARPGTALGAMAGGALLAACLLVLSGIAVHTLIYTATALMGLTGAAWNGLVMSFLVDASDPGRSGRAAGRVQAAFMAGLCVSPSLFGLAADRTGSFLPVWVAAAVIYVLALAVAYTRVPDRRVGGPPGSWAAAG